MTSWPAALTALSAALTSAWAECTATTCTVPSQASHWTAASPSDAHVVAGSETGEVFYWDLVEAQVVRRFKAHGGVVCSLAVHPNGGTLLTSSVDGTVKVWTV